MEIKQTIALKNVCPDCQCPMIRRTSEMAHPLLQIVYFACKNIFCGATFIGRTEITHRTSPSAAPNPDLNIPFTPRFLERVIVGSRGQSDDGGESAGPILLKGSTESAKD